MKSGEVFSERSVSGVGTRVFRFTIRGASDLPGEIVERLLNTLDTELVGLPNVNELDPVPFERGAIMCASRGLDAMLDARGETPREISSRLVHVIAKREFRRRIGDMSGAVRLGHAYLPRVRGDRAFFTVFVPTLCHEMMHLSAAITAVFEITESGAVYLASLGDGFWQGPMFHGLCEAVTEYGAVMMRALVLDFLGIGKSFDQEGSSSVYGPHMRIVDYICKRHFMADDGLTGWLMLVSDYWSGRRTFLDWLEKVCPDEYVALRDMGSDKASALLVASELGIRL